MAHKQQIDYCILMKSLFPYYFKYRSVLDIGSMDINGNNKYLFNMCNYLGVDIGPGKNVDYIGYGHKLTFENGEFDTIITTEVAEHDKYWPQTMTNAIRMLDGGGALIFTCATTGRPEHGTKRTDEFSSPYTTDYYKNVTEEMLRSINGFNEAWEYCRFSVNNESHDLQFFGIKKGGSVEFNPSLFPLIKLKCYQFYKLRITDYKNAFKRLIAKFT